MICSNVRSSDHSLSRSAGSWTPTLICLHSCASRVSPKSHSFAISLKLATYCAIVSPERWYRSSNCFMCSFVTLFGSKKVSNLSTTFLYLSLSASSSNTKLSYTVLFCEPKLYRSIATLLFSVSCA